MTSNHLILCRPLLLLPPIPPSIRIFSNESALRIRWPKYWSFSFNISLSSEHPGLISFRMDWLDLLAVQGTLKSLLQHHSSKASVFRCSAFFIVQLSHPYTSIVWQYEKIIMSWFPDVLDVLYILQCLESSCHLTSPWHWMAVNIFSLVLAFGGSSVKTLSPLLLPLLLTPFLQPVAF